MEFTIKNRCGTCSCPTLGAETGLTWDWVSWDVSNVIEQNRNDQDAFYPGLSWEHDTVWWWHPVPGWTLVTGHTGAVTGERRGVRGSYLNEVYHTDICVTLWGLFTWYWPKLTVFRSCSLLGAAICQQQLILDYATTQPSGQCSTC